MSTQSKYLTTSPKIAVHPSARGGWGVFAVSAIEARVVIEECHFVLVDSALAEAMEGHLSDYLFAGKQRYPGRSLIGSGNAMLYNHDAAPNTQVMLASKGPAPVLRFFTTAQVLAGEELTIDYGLPYWDRIRRRLERLQENADLLAVAQSECDNLTSTGGVTFFPRGIALPRQTARPPLAVRADRRAAKIARTIERKGNHLAHLRSRRLGLITDLITGSSAPGATLQTFTAGAYPSLPIHWKVIPLSSLTTSVVCGSLPTSAGRSDDESGTLVLGRRNIDHFGLDLISVRRLPAGQERLPVSLVIERGDILYARGGNAVVLPDRFGPVALDQEVALLRPDPERILPQFLAYALSAWPVREQWRHNRGQEVADLQIAVPSTLDEQDELVAHVGTAQMRMQPMMSRARRDLGLLHEHQRALADLFDC